MQAYPSNEYNLTLDLFSYIFTDFSSCCQGHFTGKRCLAE